MCKKMCVFARLGLDRPEFKADPFGVAT